MALKSSHLEVTQITSAPSPSAGTSHVTLETAEVLEKTRNLVRCKSVSRRLDICIWSLLGQLKFIGFPTESIPSSTKPLRLLFSQFLKGPHPHCILNCKQLWYLPPFPYFRPLKKTYWFFSPSFPCPCLFESKPLWLFSIYCFRSLYHQFSGFLFQLLTCFPYSWSISCYSSFLSNPSVA